ncbi:cobalamin biosynthesis protein P47K [Methylomonas lenta]|uniref:Cobalamin biosynthesis protein P47K n=1 Tax=Methylomonas lenta TaxID=980561 RepID=A0A177NCX5_9GAMM|nr:GTP-binding protein [Methylomonas lenta]OAI15908.1 cobalamin biosynthesis protein P47K [Methylomonas lenta]
MSELAKIPVIVVTGFLGSGKTTLLNRMLADGVKTALVINEFGATPIDQTLLLNQDIPMTVLSGGCLCCQIKGALAPTLKNLWMAWNKAETKPFERVIIETSGVASPEPILDTLLREPWLSKRYRLQQIVATLAIPSAIAQLERHAEARAQMAWADLLLLTHADLADATQHAELIDYLKLQAPATPTLTATHDLFDACTLQSKTPPSFRRIPSGQALPEHGFHSVSLYLEHSPSWPKLQDTLQTLLINHADDLVRIKGVVYFPECTEPFAVHAVAGHLYPPVPLPERPNQDSRSRLVLITVSNPEHLANELLIHLSAERSQNPIRLH